MKYKVEVLCYGETKWVSNNLTFETKEQAETYGADLFSRWTAVKEYRVVPS
jgi:hypothetical protein